MPDLKCPGRASSAILDTLVTECPQCSREIELFGDEVKIRCRCGHWVFREVLPACAQWCQEAERCFGFVGSFPKSMLCTCSEEDLRAQEKRLRELMALAAQARSSCHRPEDQSARQRAEAPEATS